MIWYLFGITVIIIDVTEFSHVHEPNEQGHSGEHHGHHHDYPSANRDHYDKDAQAFDERPSHQELARRTTLMDYACGTGLVSRELSSHVKTVVGVDISQGMVDQYNLRVSNQGISPDEMKAVCIELKGSGEELDGTKFDLIVCASSYHHFPSVDETTRILATFLKPGGSLLVTDILKNDESKDILGDFGHVVAHTSGFSEEEVKGIFERAALGEFSFTKATKAKFHGNEVDMFLARGVKL
ncbi:S-adenosyl-L-methionine-dependent methyltransferase superfamily protein [Abortiporus biennis]